MDCRALRFCNDDSQLIDMRLHLEDYDSEENMKDDMNQAGYDKEADYFYKLNKELIDKKRAALDAVPNATKPANWMQCPKCGSGMKEIILSGINIDECSSCKGVFFDAGELDILIESKEPKGFLGLFKKK